MLIGRTKSHAGNWQRHGCQARHSKIGTEHGRAYANLSMHFLRALFNFSIAQYEAGAGNVILGENPVIRLNQTALGIALTASNCY